MHNEECWWSDQKKRGPAKDYLRSLQDRLQENEKLLLSLLEEVSDSTVANALHRDLGSTSTAPSHQTWTGSLSGQEYWTRYPLNRLESIRDWQRQRTATALRPASEIPAPPVMTTRHERDSHFQEPTPPQPTMVTTQPIPDTISRDNGLISPYPNGHQQAYQSTNQSPSTDWQSPQEPKTSLHERRYSEETRGVAEALFSISHQGNQARMQAQPQQQQEQQQPMLDSGDSRTASAPVLEKLPSQFPTHLFW